MDLMRPEGLREVAKPWGREVWWAVTDRYLGKRLDIRGGGILSLQFHQQKLESLYLLSGRARLQVGDEVCEFEPGAAITLPPGTVHRIEALDDCVLFEVSTPHPDDVVRLTDLYGRAPGAGCRHPSPSASVADEGE